MNIDVMKYVRTLTGFSLLLASILISSPAGAQIAERVYQKDYKIDPAKKGELSVELDNISFFKDNEYTGKIMKGYSLPGLWIQPKAVFYALENIKLEAGFHALAYWGTNRYPNFAYQDITTWKGEGYQTGLHVLPYFRAQIALSSHVDLILGDIYGGSNHRLIEPLYSPELNLTADPEVGLQLLYNSRAFDLDAWVNWESFIFYNDTHQEAFTVGLSSRLKLNNPASRFHFYMPAQVLIQHRGGEIDTIYHNSVQTLMNAAVGVGAVWNIGHPVFKNVNVELDGTGYYQQAGELWPFNQGAGGYFRASADIYDFRVKASYWKCKDFISMFGSPFYGAASTISEGTTFDGTDMLYFGLEYSRSLGKGYSMGIDMDIYNHFPMLATHADNSKENVGSAMSFAVGVYFRINPSFLIKNF